MLDFLFHWPPRMLFGVDSHKKIGEEMQGVSSKALIVCAKGPFRENGLYDDVKNSLERAGIQTYGMGDIDQNPEKVWRSAKKKRSTPWWPLAAAQQWTAQN